MPKPKTLPKMRIPVADALKELRIPGTEQTVFLRYHGVGKRRQHTTAELARLHNLTPGRVQSIIAGTRKKLEAYHEPEHGGRVVAEDVTAGVEVRPNRSAKKMQAPSNPVPAPGPEPIPTGIRRKSQSQIARERRPKHVEVPEHLTRELEEFMANRPAGAVSDISERRSSKGKRQAREEWDRRFGRSVVVETKQAKRP